MLPAQHRLRRRADFSLAVRAGRRAGSAHLVAHLMLPDAPATRRTVATSTSAAQNRSPQMASSPTPPRVGFVVSKAVGTAVVRNQVKRRLRAVLAQRVDRLPAGSLLVVRANPTAAQASSSELARAVDRVLGRLLPASAVVT